MATIKGIGFKALKSFQTGDGVGFSANLYMDNKKVGFAQDQGCGGEVEFHILKPEDRAEYSKRVQEYYKENPAEMDNEYDFINELYEITETEKQFKKNAKKGFPIIIQMSFHKRTDTIEQVFAGGYKPDIMVGVRDENVAQSEIEKQKPVEYKIFRTLEDFNI